MRLLPSMSPLLILDLYAAWDTGSIPAASVFHIRYQMASFCGFPVTRSTSLIDNWQDCLRASRTSADGTSATNNP